MTEKLKTDIDLHRLDDMFKNWIVQMFHPIMKTVDDKPITIIMSTADRWVQILKQQDQNIIYPAIVIKRKFNPKPSDHFLFKSFDSSFELYRKINAEQSAKAGKVVMDIAKIKSPSYIAIGYDVVLLSLTVEHTNTFHTTLYDNLQKNAGILSATKTVKDHIITDLFFNVFLGDTSDEGNINNFAADIKKFFAGATFKLEGWVIKDSDIKIYQTSPRATIDVVEYISSDFVI